jgi:hypothetical protein
MDTNLPSSEKKEETPAAPPAEHHDTPPVAAPAAATPTTPASPSPKAKSPMMMGVIAGVVILLGVGGYFLMDMLNTPAKVKGKAEVVQPAFTDYSKAMTKISDYMLDDTSSSSDSDSIERSVEKGKNLVKEAGRTKKTLSGLLSDVNMSQTKDYKTAIESYIKTAEMVEKEADANVTLGEAYIEPLRKLEDMSVELSGASTYMYSDPEKYNQILTSAIKDVDAITKQLESAKATGDLQESHTLFVKTMKAQSTFLSAILDAVKSRETNAIATATQAYAEEAQALQKDISRVSDKMKDTNEEQADALEELQEKVETEYQDLKREYKF